MIPSFSTGFFLGLSLIIAIGAQNAFVLRQGIIQKYVFQVALFCSLSDALLISFGVTGVSFFLEDQFNKFSIIIFRLSALWLFFYGLLRLKDVLKPNFNLKKNNSVQNTFLSTISIAAILTFANPHVYLDTMLLIGTVSHQYSGNAKVFYTIGACLASFVWFFGLAYGAKFLTPIMQKPFAWRLLDSAIAIIMFAISYQLAVNGNWL